MILENVHDIVFEKDIIGSYVSVNEFQVVHEVDE